MNREFFVTVFDQGLVLPRALSSGQAEKEGLGTILSDFKSRLSGGIDFCQCRMAEDLPLVDSIIAVQGELADYYKDVSGISHTRFVSVKNESEAHIKLNDILFVCTGETERKYTVFMFLEALVDCVVLSWREKIILTRDLVI